MKLQPKRTKRIIVRLTEQEYAELQRYNTYETLSEYVRAKLFSYNILRDNMLRGNPVPEGKQ